ncbi:YjcZ family sporulation protein [Psychrobacillus sp. MER TA 171]
MYLSGYSSNRGSNFVLIVVLFILFNIAKM